MKLSRAQRDIALALIMDPMPASVRGEFITDEKFCAKFGLTPKFWFMLDADHAVETGSLHNALRAAISGRKTANLHLRGSRRIRAKLSQKADNARIIIGKKGFGFSNSDLLSVDRKVRVKALERVIAKQALMPFEEDKWRSLLKKRPLKDREFVDLMTDFAATPEAFTTEFERPRNFGADDLMPDSPEYYLRLIGALAEQLEFDAFIEGPLGVARKELITRHPRVALRRIAFTALWQPLIPFDLLKLLKSKDVAALLNADDPFSLLCGFELCRSFLSSDAKYADLGSKFLEKLLADKKASVARCNLFAALAMISMVKVRNKVKTSSVPLFWVRLAALAHAGVLTNALSALTDTSGFLKWASENFYPHYLWTCAIDLQAAPRWNPEWLDPDFLYAELVGRVQGSIALLAEDARPKRWTEITTIAIERLKVSGKLLAANFPGPFDDFRKTSVMLSSDIDVFKDVEKKLHGASQLGKVPELIALANVSQPSEQIVEDVHRILNGPIDDAIAEKHELTFFRLCARIGRVTRNVSIANLVINRCFFVARQPKRNICITDIFEIMIEACGAHADINRYRTEVGECAMKLSFAIEGSTDLRSLIAIFDVLSIRDERMTASLGRAIAIAKTKSGRYGPSVLKVSKEKPPIGG